MLLIMFVLLSILLIMFVYLDIDEIQLRIEMAFAGVGVSYRPGKPTCFVVSFMVFFLLYVLIFSR